MNSEGEMAKTRGKSVTAGTKKKLKNPKPWQSGNPKGRPKGARETQFLEALEADFKFGTRAYGSGA